MVSTTEGLRDRRRQQTRREIHAAALRVAAQLGFGKVTVDLISAEAGVSPRTFFNYFPNKESAFLPLPAELSPALAAEFAERGDARPREVLADLTRLLVRELIEYPPRREELHHTFALTRSHPAMLAAMLASFDGYQRSIAEAVGKRLGQRPDGEVPVLITALALTAVRIGVERWVTEETTSDPDDSAVRYVERSAELLQTLLTS